MKKTKYAILAAVLAAAFAPAAHAQSPLQAEVLASAPRMVSVTVNKEVCNNGAGVEAIPQEADTSTARMVGEVVGGVLGAAAGTLLLKDDSPALTKALSGAMGAAAGKWAGEKVGDKVGQKLWERKVAAAKAALEPGQYINEEGYVCRAEETVRDVLKGYTSMVQVKGHPQPYVVATDRALSVGAQMRVWFNREGDLELVP